MPIRSELRRLYPTHWPEISRRIRFDRAKGKCERCQRPHGSMIRCLPDGRWFDSFGQTWRDARGRSTRWPTLMEAIEMRTTRVILAAAHLDNDPENNRLRNLRSLCQRCHMIQDRGYYLAQRWITCRLRYARGDIFLGPYRSGADRFILRMLMARFATAARLGRAHGPGPMRPRPSSSIQLVLDVRANDNRAR
jgi:hypothetical protein